MRIVRLNTLIVQNLVENGTLLGSYIWSILTLLQLIWFEDAGIEQGPIRLGTTGPKSFQNLKSKIHRSVHTFGRTKSEQLKFLAKGNFSFILLKSPYVTSTVLRSNS